jgi:hypothetical protein
VFRVGPDEFRFGSILDRVTHPELAEGYLPIVEIRYLHPHPAQATEDLAINQTPSPAAPEIYRLEAFCATDPALAENGVVFARFSLAQGTIGMVTAEIEARSPLKFAKGRVADAEGRVLACFDRQWKWERGAAHVRIGPGQSAVLVVPTRPLDDPAALEAGAEAYQRQRAKCAKTWKEILGRAMLVETPEPYVNHAWRNLLVQNFQMCRGDRIHYSADNQYDKLYEAEGSDAALAMMLWGYHDQMRRMIVPLLDFTRKGLEFHQAGLKLNDVVQLYWQTRDAAFVESLRPRWEKELRRILEGRTLPYGLFPKERYCGDVGTQVHSLSASAKAWRAVRDMAAVLDDMGRAGEARPLAEAAAEYRQGLLAAIENSARRDVSPPFVPIALLGDEMVHDPITETRIGSYWNLVINYVIGSGIFPPGSPQENWIPQYLQEHGGLALGMLRAGSGPYTFWNSQYRINPLYGMRYIVDTLRRDDPERALVSFYGMLAQGLTRNTFIGGEGAMLTPIDAGGRFFYCPPNSAGNGLVLTVLRHLLIQDFDFDDDGRPETLRLLFGVPRRWLEDGRAIRVRRAPTAFGPVSVEVQSKLREGLVLAEADLPQRNQPQKSLLRVRVPEGWRVVSAQADCSGPTPCAAGNPSSTECAAAEAGGGAVARALEVDERGTVDLTGLQGHVVVRFRVAAR